MILAPEDEAEHRGLTSRGLRSSATVYKRNRTQWVAHKLVRSDAQILWGSGRCARFDHTKFCSLHDHVYIKCVVSISGFVKKSSTSVVSGVKTGYDSHDQSQNSMQYKFTYVRIKILYHIWSSCNDYLSILYTLQPRNFVKVSNNGMQYKEIILHPKIWSSRRLLPRGNERQSETWIIRGMAALFGGWWWY